MSDPELSSRPELIPCSVDGCERAAAAILYGELLCPEHVKLELERRREDPDPDHK